MTLGQIMMLALRQLDEDPQDISEYDDMFRSYANEGYRIALNEYIKPREEREMRSDDTGVVYLDTDIKRVIGMQQKLHDSLRREIPFEPSATGDSVKTGYPDAKFIAVCEVEPAGMETENDEPAHMPEWSHNALADYVCYRHLINGNEAKQRRAQQYLQIFYQTLRRIRPSGMGSTRNFSNLYTATDIRRVR